MTPGNRMFKFADDTCLVAPAINTSSYLDEIVHIESWASENSLKLNCAKSKEIYFVCEKNVASRHSCRHRVWTLRESTAWKSWALLLKRSNTYIACWHHSVVCCTLSMCYAVTASHAAASLHEGPRATILAKTTYCSTAWAGSCTAPDRAKLDNFIRRCKRLGYCDNRDIFSDADDSSSDSIMTNSNHVLYLYLPESRHLIYSLRERSHNRSLITIPTSMNMTFWYGL